MERCSINREGPKKRKKHSIKINANSVSKVIVCVTLSVMPEPMSSNAFLGIYNLSCIMPSFNQGALKILFILNKTISS